MPHPHLAHHEQQLGGMQSDLTRAVYKLKENIVDAGNITLVVMELYKTKMIDHYWGFIGRLLTQVGWIS